MLLQLGSSSFLSGYVKMYCLWSLDLETVVREVPV